MTANSRASGAMITKQMATSENIQVAVRLRPMTEREKQKGNKRIVDIEQNTVQLINPRHSHDRYKKFTFDYSYWSYDGFKKNAKGQSVADPDHPNGGKYVDQERVFNDLGHFLLSNALEGYHSALLAYGQTGSGKSYTVSGYGANEGILPRFARSLYIELEKRTGSSSQNDGDKENAEELNSDETNNNAESPPNKRYEVHFSMIEIYNEVVRDLLPKSAHGGASSAGQPSESSAGPSESATSVEQSARINSSLHRKGLKVREHPVQGFFVERLSSYICRDKEEIERRIEEGQLNKSIAATRMNETSSRGHTIYEFRIKQYKHPQKEAPSEGEESGAKNSSSARASSDSSVNDDVVITSVVQLVDLAGSERTAIHLADDNKIQIQQAPATGKHRSVTPERSNKVASSRGQSGSTNANAKDNSSPSSVRRTATVQGSGMRTDHQARFKESISINQSLSALGNCIQVMSQYSQQMEQQASNNQASLRARPSLKLPYRDSVLTKLLNKCCLSGNSKVVIIATLSPADCHFDDTLSTLRFADRAKQIKTHAVINQVRRDSVAVFAPTGLRKGGLNSRNQRKMRQIAENDDGSNDSSQTSNFDQTENAADNFSGKGIGESKGSSKTGTFNRSRGSKQTSSSMSYSRSNPSLAMIEGRSKRSKIPTLQDSPGPAETSESRIRKSISEATSLAVATRAELEGENEDEEDLDELNDYGDGRDGLMSPESDDSVAALADEDLSTDEKIEILNRMLNHNSESTKIPQPSRNSSRMERPRKSRIRNEIKQVSLISNTLKKTNPYISVLNPDEQLSGVVSYIIKQGTTIVGRDGDCDVVIHGPEIKSRHAKIIRDLVEGTYEERIYLEPIVETNDPGSEEATANANDSSKSPNIRVNGFPVLERIELHHCDRILLGTNSYFVCVKLNWHSKQTGSESNNEEVARVGDLDLVTYEMAKNEVLRGVITDDKNKGVLKEINGYTHRPGTGKYKKQETPIEGKAAISDSKNNSRAGSSQVTSEPTHNKLKRTTTIQDGMENLAQATSSPIEVTYKQDQSGPDLSAIPAGDGGGGGGEDTTTTINEEQDEIYRKQLMEDTYDYVIPVTEVNAIAMEMGIKVSYELKIVNGEEQLPNNNNYNGFFDSNASDAFSSSSVGDNGEQCESGKTSSYVRGENEKPISASESSTGVFASSDLPSNNEVTYLCQLHDLDIPPALYVKVHMSDYDVDFYWHKDKFQVRRYKMLELYGPWSLGGKSGLVEYLIEQSRTQSNYLIDPFVDDPSTYFVLIGHAQITLQPIAHMTDKRQVYDVINMNDETVATIEVEAIPCHPGENPQSRTDRPSSELSNQYPSDSERAPPFRTFSEDELNSRLLEDSSALLGERLVFMLKIHSCTGLIAKFTNVFCQYSLGSRDSLIRTRAFHHDDLNVDSETNCYEPLEFSHSHFICIDNVTNDVLDFLEFGFLTIQLVGQHRIKESMIGHSPSMISTIINSINKYKYKIEQSSNYAVSNYSNGDYFLNSAHSSKSTADMEPGRKANIKSGVSSLRSDQSASTMNANYDQKNNATNGEFDENGLLINGKVPQENVIEMILTKRKLNRAENQLVSCSEIK